MNFDPTEMDSEEPWEVQLLRQFCDTNLSLEGVSRQRERKGTCSGNCSDYLVQRELKVVRLVALTACVIYAYRSGLRVATVVL